tara:strand:- start:185 stop:619 length:435 start_codon:yes stop_codon:yes gene_type:complete
MRDNDSSKYIQKVKSTSQINIRSWRYVGRTALEDMVLGMDECAIRDTHNTVSSDEFYECIAIVVCQMGENIFAHAAQICGHYKGEAANVWDCSRGAGPPPGHTYEIKAISRIHRVPEQLAGPINDQGIADHYRVAVLHYLLDMG